MACGTRPRCASVACLLLVALCWRAACAAELLTLQEQFQFDSLTITRLTLGDSDSDSASPPVRYYLSLPAQRAPLVLYIQGSGCTPPFVGLGSAQRYSTIFSWLPLAAQKRYAVMAVDKPFQLEQTQQGQPGAAIGCAGGFNQHFSYGAWLATLKRAVRHALTRPEVDARRVLVLGISEGATMAAGLARALPEVSDVVLFGANGPSQLYDFAATIHVSGASDEEKLRQLQQLETSFNAIVADPDSTSKFVWGHTYLRWSSFFAQSTMENLARSTARVYLASGMRDHNVPILSTEVLYAQLRAQGRDVTFRRIPLAGHNLAPEGRTILESQPEYDAAMAWFARQ